MSTEQVLRIARTDSEGDFVLVYVLSNGASDLDLKLAATEGEFPYVATIKQSGLSKYRSKNSHVSDDQWQTVLRSSFLRESPDANVAPVLEHLQLLASIVEDRLAIIFRRNISGITQRLGEIILTKDENQEINIIAWAAAAVTRGDDLEVQVKTLSRNYTEQEEVINKLNKQLEDLVKAKKEHEDSLLGKFSELLNSKKLKIRDQQRLLAGAKIDPEKGSSKKSSPNIKIDLVSPAAQVHSTRTSSAIHPARVSRARKRKSPSPVPSDSEFEKMAVDRESLSPKPEDEPSNLSTPRKADSEATEGSEDDDDIDPPSNPRIEAGTEVGARGKAIENAAKTSKSKEIHEPPPRRELPFGKAGIGKVGGAGAQKDERAGESAVEPAHIEASGEEQDESDDEL